MSLIEADRRPRQLGLSPLRIAGAATIGSSVFVVIIAGAAWVSRGVHDREIVVEDQISPPELVVAEPALGPSAYEPEFTDAGPPDVLPLDAVLDLDALADEALSPLTRCGREALRWDPAVGGGVVAQVRLEPPHQATLLEHGVTSAMITMCMARITNVVVTTQTVPAAMDLRIIGVLDAPAGVVRMQRVWVEPITN